MTTKNKQSVFDENILQQQLHYLKLTSVKEQYGIAAKQAVKNNWTHVQYLAELTREEVCLRQQRSMERRIRLARFPVVKTMDDFDWNWPKKINRLQVENLMRLDFINEKANAIFMGGVGLGKTHLSTALAYQACLKGYTVLFAPAIDIVNTLNAAQNAGRLKPEMKKYLKPAVLFIDELGYLPIDKKGADMLFQVISQRYEQGTIILTTNKPFKKWPEIFGNDSTLTSAVLDRLLHHAEICLLEGKSYRMKDSVDV
ncbi:MAG: ATP-binding protein [Bacteroidia bacterium]|nr:ATP-binding protein [Bacteroidia bacterium]